MEKQALLAKTGGEQGGFGGFGGGGGATAADKDKKVPAKVRESVGKDIHVCLSRIATSLSSRTDRYL